MSDKELGRVHCAKCGKDVLVFEKDLKPSCRHIWNSAAMFRKLDAEIRMIREKFKSAGGEL